MVGSSNRPSQAWPLIRASWHLLLRDKKLLVFPALSGICCVLLVWVNYPQLFSGSTGGITRASRPGSELMNLLSLFLLYLCLQFVIIFFNCAVVACVAMRINGEEPTLGKGLSAAVDRLPQIVVWSLVAATVGAALKIIEAMFGRFRDLVGIVLEISWAAVSFLVIPILVMERKTGFGVTRASRQLLRETWGEGLRSTFRLYRLSLYLNIGGMILLAVGFMIPSSMVTVVFIVLTALYVPLSLTAQSALKNVLQTALYYYARHGIVAEGFRRESLRWAFFK
jgi:hypothetical protein